MTEIVRVPADAPYSRIERFRSVGSTNDVARGWLAAGTPEVCVALADEQTAGRGRMGRSWTAPAGAALLLSTGFRPTWLRPDRWWRLSATVALAMIDAAEEVSGLAEGAIRLKWPNDLVVETTGPDAPLSGAGSIEDAIARLGGQLELRKLAGVLGESDGAGTDDPRVVVGIGINGAWPATGFPAELAGTMTSLHEASGGRPVDRDALLDSFLRHLEGRLEALRAGSFDSAAWAGRQALPDRLVRLEGYASHRGEDLLVEGVDGSTGGLVVRRPAPSSTAWTVHAGEVSRVRFAPAVGSGL